MGNSPARILQPPYSFFDFIIDFMKAPIIPAKLAWSGLSSSFSIVLHYLNMTVMTSTLVESPDFFTGTFSVSLSLSARTAFQGIYDTRSEVLRTEKAYSTTKGCSSWNWPNGTYQDHVEAPVDTAFENVKHKHRYIILTPCKECSIVEGRYSVRKGFLGKITPVYVMLHTTPHTTTMKISSILCTIHSVLVAMFYCSTPEPTSVRSLGTRCFASPTLFEATKEARQRQSEATTTWKEQQTGVTLAKSLASLLNHPLYDPHTFLDTD